MLRREGLLAGLGGWQLQARCGRAALTVMLLSEAANRSKQGMTGKFHPGMSL